MFRASEKHADKRLHHLGIKGGQPATQALSVRTEQQNHKIVDATVAQRTGASIAETIKRVRDGDLHMGARVKWARIETHIVVGRKRTIAPEKSIVDDHEHSRVELPQYLERYLICNVCGDQRETKFIQSRTPNGYRAILCLKCHIQRWSGWMNCVCGTCWHQCTLHRVDPPFHRRMKRPSRGPHIENGAFAIG